jgi:hypothetical protein
MLPPVGEDPASETDSRRSIGKRRSLRPGASYREMEPAGPL